MSDITLSSKGQLVIPKHIRDRHNWSPGTAFSVEDKGDHLELRPLYQQQKPFKPTRVEDVAGCLAKYVAGQRLTRETEQQAIADYLKAKHGRD